MSGRPRSLPFAGSASLFGLRRWRRCGAEAADLGTQRRPLANSPRRRVADGGRRSFEEEPRVRRRRRFPNARFDGIAVSRRGRHPLDGRARVPVRGASATRPRFGSDRATAPWLAPGPLREPQGLTRCTDRRGWTNADPAIPGPSRRRPSSSGGRSCRTARRRAAPARHGLASRAVRRATPGSGVVSPHGVASPWRAACRRESCPSLAAGIRSDHELIRTGPKPAPSCRSSPSNLSERLDQRSRDSRSPIR